MLIRRVLSSSGMCHTQIYECCYTRNTIHLRGDTYAGIAGAVCSGCGHYIHMSPPASGPLRHQITLAAAAAAAAPIAAVMLRAAWAKVPNVRNQSVAHAQIPSALLVKHMPNSRYECYTCRAYAKPILHECHTRAPRTHAKTHVTNANLVGHMPNSKYGCHNSYGMHQAHDTSVMCTSRRYTKLILRVLYSQGICCKQVTKPSRKKALWRTARAMVVDETLGRSAFSPWQPGYPSNRGIQSTRRVSFRARPG